MSWSIYLSTTGNKIHEFEMLSANVGIDIFNQNQLKKGKRSFLPVIDIWCIDYML